MKCTNCNAQWKLEEPKKIINCPFCETKLPKHKSYEEGTYEEKILSIIDKHAIEIYNNPEKFTKIVAEIFADDDKFSRLLQKIILEEGSVLIYKNNKCSNKEFQKKYDATFEQINEKTFISREIQAPAVDLLWFGIGKITSYTSNLEDFEISNGVLTGYYGSNFELVIPDCVTAIAPFAFSGFQALKSVTIPSSVTKIGENAFEYCTNLEKVILPTSIKTLPNEIFRACENLHLIKLPNTINSIGGSAFRGCKNLYSIKMPNSITKILDYTFSGCENLHSVKLPNSLISIGSYGFATCMNLHTISLPNQLTTLGEHCFYECENLRSVEIPKSLIIIGDYAFTTLNGTSYWNLPLDFMCIKQIKKINPLATA